jgi:site-specific DNA recombinase
MQKSNQDVPKPSSFRLRCAIYTRKSTEEGLEQEFNSLDAQREAAEAYIQSQRREGWIALPELYDDGGFTGANMDRPALTRLLQAVEGGELDCVVVWQCDSSPVRESPALYISAPQRSMPACG